MPVTPNYKIDKKSLPYPDEAELRAAAMAGKKSNEPDTPTQQIVREIWASRLRLPQEVIDLDDDFSAIGGHSMRAQEILFDVKRWANKSFPMTIIFRNPTVRSFAAAIDAALDPANHSAIESANTTDNVTYAEAAEILKESQLPRSFPTGSLQGQNILLTGATGFLGAAILTKCLSQDLKVIALVRAKSEADALQRIKTSCTAYFKWSESWIPHIKCILGDISEENLGLDGKVWKMLETTVDIVIHNAAVVHWIRTYRSLEPTNVLSTVSLIKLCSLGKKKHITFISSTAVLDSGKYPTGSPVLEIDDLERSCTGLTSGYGQTKYVSEFLLREAGKLGLQSAIVRPGYITGNADTGIGPTDDFLLRMLKGSVQLECRPDLARNTINLVPVSYCVDVVVSASLTQALRRCKEEGCGVTVYHVTPHPQLSFNAFLANLQSCGYKCPLVSYEKWRAKLEEYVKSHDADREPHALLPLFDWVTSDLPSDTSSKLLDDVNTQALLRDYGSDSTTQSQVRVTEETVRAYLRFMVGVGFLDPPTSSSDGEELGRLGMTRSQRDAFDKVGRGGA